MAPSSEVLQWLGRAMVVARERAGLEIYDIVPIVRKRSETVKRWEDGGHMPRDLDETLRLYAEAVGLDGPRDLWELALTLWREDDAPKRVAEQVRAASRPPDERQA